MIIHYLQIIKLRHQRIKQTAQLATQLGAEELKSEPN